MKRVPIPTLIIALLLLGILGAYAFTYQTRFNQISVVLEFGKVKEVVKEPGLRFKWPIPIQKIVPFDKRAQVLDLNESEIKTKDGKNIIVGAYAIWRIQDAKIFMNVSSGSTRKGRDILEKRLTQHLQTVVSGRGISDFVNRDTDELDSSYDSMEKALRKAAGFTLPGEAGEDVILSELGIKIERFQLRRYSFPAQATQKIFEAMKEERNEIAKRYEAEGDSEANAITSKAKTDAQNILAFAGRRAQEIRSEGTRSATRIMNEISNENEELFIWLRWLEATKAALSQKTTIFLDADSPFFQVFSQPKVIGDFSETKEVRDN